MRIRGLLCRLGHDFRDDPDVPLGGSYLVQNAQVLDHAVGTIGQSNQHVRSLNRRIFGPWLGLLDPPEAQLGRQAAGNDEQEPSAPLSGTRKAIDGVLGAPADRMRTGEATRVKNLQVKQ